MSIRLRLAAAAVVAACAAAAAADYDLRVDLKNVSGEAKKDWPVVLRAYTVLGRNLPPGAVDPGGFHVYDPAGKEVPCMVQPVPPLDQPGNDELVFVVPAMQPGQTLTYRITNTPQPGKRAKIDLVGSGHNLIAAGGFEPSQAGGPSFGAPAAIDGKVARSGKGSLRLSADGKTATSKYARPIPLHKGSWYYFGAWSKTETVSRFGYQAGGGCYVSLAAPPAEGDKAPPAAFQGPITPQCSTRDWMRMTFGGNRNAAGGVDPWGMDRYTARALHEKADLALSLRQRKHYYMAPGRTRGTWWLDDLVLMEQPETVVRFDLAVRPLMTDGVFLFTRPATTYLGRLVDKGRAGQPWCGFPYPHEKLTRLERLALRGQHVSYCIGVYHTRPVADALVRLAGGALTGPGGERLGADVIEYLPGFAGEGTGRYMRPLTGGEAVQPVNLPGKLGVRYFFLTFRVPAGAKAGRYAGKVEVVFGGKVFRTVPISLRVQDMVQPIPDDVFVGSIFQGGRPPFNDAGMKVYARSGFNCLTRFGGFLGYSKDAAGKRQVDLEKLDERMKWLKGYALSGVAVFSDFDLGPKWNGGSLLKRTRPADFNNLGKWGDRLKAAEAAFKAQIRRIEQARKDHPEWPELIYMTWDEPGGGRNGRPDPAMAWVNQVAPKAITTLDVQFAPLQACLKWYTAPAFDDPANWAGPEIYRWVKKQGKNFGFCGSAREEGDSARYQAGMLMIASGAKYFHAWHLGRPDFMAQNMAFDKQTGQVVRAVSMINWGEGMNDLKAYKLLQAALAEARKSGGAKARPAVQAAEDYLKGVFAVFNGDHKPTWPNEPYLGTTNDWGSEGFYDRWQEQMLRHAAALKGVTWVE